jgi:hypothetical protein
MTTLATPLERLCCWHCAKPAVKVAHYDGGLEVGLCDEHQDSPPALTPATCSVRGCRDVVEAATCCGDCGKVYHRCGRHGGRQGAARSLKSHRGLYHPAGQR